MIQPTLYDSYLPNPRNKIIFRTPEDLSSDELDRIILSALRKDYPRKVRRIVSYMIRNADEFGIIIDDRQPISIRILRRLEILELNGKVKHTYYGWVLK